ncbi:MAG TPA: glucan biosynthesis protein G [Steroidobacteraceae bacterium]|nr:glucan biosynthesis protein G [Steroidobacteraceae bacterium]
MLLFQRTQLAAATVALLLLTSAIGQTASTPQQPQAPAFTFASVQRLAQERAARPYHIRSTPLPRALATLSYDQYRRITFRPAAALWHGQSMFEVQFFHRGFNFDRRVNIYEVLPSGVRPVVYNPAMFQFGKGVPHVQISGDLGFAGLRVHYPLNSPGYKDEVIAFLGASYFRALGRNEGYGVSARGLALDTASPAGEEYAYFTDFYLVRPEPNQRVLTIYALLDSPSLAGAYQFEVRPGTVTQVQVSAVLYPRRAIAKLGIAPLTSMFLYGESSEGRPFDDWRPEVHDSDGLMMQTGTGEWLWRPLDNPSKLQVNRFMDQSPKGFGLIQRDRSFADYEDPDSQYERRPSYWIQPLGNWGKGGIELVEIPSDEEIHQNIDAYWVPAAPVVPHSPIRFSYLMSAYMGSGGGWPPGGKVVGTRFGPVLNGTTPVSGMRLVLIDFAGGDLDSLLPSQPVHADVSADGGTITHVTVQRLSENGAWRVILQVKPGGDQPVDLRCYLDLYGEALTETWTYQWTPAGA